MATVFAAPKEIPLPSIASETWREDEAAYVAKLTEMARANGDAPEIGKEIRFPRGDGYARYLVWSARPLQLVWLQIGDAWQVEEALIRGLRITDLRLMIKRDESLKALFAERRKEKVMDG